MSKHNYREFFQFGKMGGSYRVPDEDINSWIDECIQNLEKYRDTDNWSISTGDTKVIVLRYHDDSDPNQYSYEIVVAKDYWRKHLHSI